MRKIKSHTYCSKLHHSYFRQMYFGFMITKCILSNTVIPIVVIQWLFGYHLPYVFNVCRAPARVSWMKSLLFSTMRKTNTRSEITKCNGTVTECFTSLTVCKCWTHAVRCYLSTCSLVLSEGYPLPIKGHYSNNIFCFVPTTVVTITSIRLHE